MTTVNQNEARVGNGLLIVMLCCLGAVCEGFDLQVPGVSAPVLRGVFEMQPSQLGMFLSMSTFAMMLGAPLGGIASDVVGRKWVLIASIVVYSLLTIATVLATDINTLYALRFAAGIGLGGALPNLVAIAVESVAPARRSLAVGVMLAGPGIGGSLASYIASVTATPDQWQIIYYAGGLGPLLLVAPLLALLLPNVRRAATDNTASAGNAMSVLFGERRTLNTLAVWLGLLSILLVLFVLMSWLPTLLVERGLTREQALLVQMVVNLSAVPGSVLAGGALDAILKRRLLLALALVYAGAMAAIALLATGPGVMSVMMAGGALAGLLVIGGQTALYALAPMVYPVWGRATGVGFGVAAGRIGSAGGPLVTGYLVAFGLTAPQVLLSLLPVAAVAAGAALFLASGEMKRSDG
ncbi:MAG: MFS transporter [Gammaproteobacteria bacterium]|nr:MFS transporter [Gammaproteobacteria bacterium]